MEKFKENLENKLNKNLHDVTKFLDVFFTDVCRINKLFYKNNPTITNPHHIRYMKKLSEFLQNLIKKNKILKLLFIIIKNILIILLVYYEKDLYIIFIFFLLELIYHINNSDSGLSFSE